MSRFYVTGVSGTGKSSLVEELRRRGIRTFDIDAVQDLCYWKNKSTGEEAIYQYGIGKDWLEAHDWVCDKAKLTELLNVQDDRMVVVAGLASNQDEYLDLFDKVFLLHCREETFLYRLNTREENNFAKEKSEQEHVLSWYKNFEDRIRKKGAIPINTDASIRAVADQILSHIILE